jgi:hypothetical protein
VTLRFLQDQGADVPTLTAHLSGLGVDQDVTLTRHQVYIVNQLQLVAEGFVYDSAVVPIDQSANGCITATITSVDDSTSFHTLGASC